MNGPATRVAVLGAGSWGTALAILLARNGARTTLWGRDPAAIAAMAAMRRNTRYLPDAEFPAALGVDVTPRLKTLKVTEPPKRTAGIKVADAADLVMKLKTEAKVI